MEPPLTDLAFREQLGDPEIAGAVARLLSRAPAVDRLVARLTETNDAADGLVAAMVDVVDEQCQALNLIGTPLDQRMASLLQLWVKFTEPDTIAAVERLVDRLPDLEQASRLLDEIPNLLAIATDVLDDFARRLKADGVELEKSIVQGLQAVLWLGCRVSQVELDRLGTLLRSDVLDPHALEVIGDAATSLATCRREACEREFSDRVGLAGLLRALRDPDVQRSLGFAIRFAKCFGHHAAAQSARGA